MIAKPYKALLNRQHPLCRGLLGLWPLNEKDGVAYDITGQTGNGTPAYNPSSAITPKSRMRAFSASSYQYMALPSIAPLSSWSLSVDFMCTGSAGPFEIIAKRSTTNGGVVDCQLDVYNNNLRLIVLDDASRNTNTSTAVSTNTYYTTCAVRDKNNLYLYLNGVLKNQATGTIGAISAINTFDVGALVAGSAARASFFDGHIGNVLFYNRALSAREVADLYANPFALYHAPRTQYPAETPWLAVAASACASALPDAALSQSALLTLASLESTPILSAAAFAQATEMLVAECQLHPYLSTVTIQQAAALLAVDVLCAGRMPDTLPLTDAAGLSVRASTMRPDSPAQALAQSLFLLVENIGLTPASPPATLTQALALAIQNASATAYAPSAELTHAVYFLVETISGLSRLDSVLLGDALIGLGRLMNPQLVLATPPRSLAVGTPQRKIIKV